MRYMFVPLGVQGPVGKACLVMSNKKKPFLTGQFGMKRAEMMNVFKKLCGPESEPFRVHNLMMRGPTNMN